MHQQTTKPSIPDFLRWLVSLITAKRQNKRMAILADDSISRIEAIVEDISQFEIESEDQEVKSFQERWEQAERTEEPNGR